MAFSLTLKSVDGYFIGRCQPIASLESAHMLNTPGESTTSLVPLNFGASYWGDAESEYNNYYVGAITHLPDAGNNPLGNFINYLDDNGYNSNQNFLVVAAFPIVNAGVDTGTQLCICAYSRTDVFGFMRYFVTKRTRTQSGWNYTIISGSESEVSITNGFTDFGLIAGQLTINGRLYYAFGFSYHGNGSGQTEKWTGAFLHGDTTAAFNTLMGGEVPGEKSSPEFGPESEPGGYGPGSGGQGGSGGPGPTFDGTSDPWIETPTKPGVLSFGLLNVYKCDAGSLQNLGSELFPEITWPPSSGFSDLMEWLGETIQAFSDSIWNKGLIDYIVSVHLIPVDVPGGTLEDIKIGPRTMTGVLARPIDNDVIEIDCGTVHIDEYYTSFVDYMTVCRVYIPYYGMVTIKPEYWQSADIQLKFLWNVMDGSFIAKLYSTISRHQSPCKTLIGQYSGSACVHMPLSGANYANMFAQLAGGLGGAAAGLASGNVALAATSAMNYAGAVGGLGNMEQSNAYNASSAYYGHSRPFLIIERPVSHYSERYNIEKGLPLLVTKNIGSCRGFTTAEDAILDGIPCTVEEKKRIQSYLRNGVIIK